MRFACELLRDAGLSRVLGTDPSVVTYFAEVPQSGRGLVESLYDMSDVEVLRGPQGVAFGKNSTGGDVLFTPQRPTDQPGGVNFGAVMVWLREYLPPNAILCNGAGNYASWVHRFFHFRRYASHVAPASGSMASGWACPFRRPDGGPRSMRCWPPSTPSDLPTPGWGPSRAASSSGC